MDLEEINQSRAKLANLCDIENMYLTCTELCERTKGLGDEDTHCALDDCALWISDYEDCLKHIIETMRIRGAIRYAKECGVDEKYLTDHKETAQ